MVQTIIFFKGVYDTLDLFTDKLVEAFDSMGFSHFIYDAGNEAESKADLVKLLEQKVGEFLHLQRILE